MSDQIVLLVEDDENDALLLERAFERAGLPRPLMIVRDGKEAIDYLRGNGEFADRQKFPSPSLMVLDLKMPRADGFAVLSWWRRQPEWRHLPIVVLSSSNQDRDLQRAMTLGASAYCVKPADLSYLVTAARGLRDRWLTPERAYAMQD